MLSAWPCGLKELRLVGSRLPAAAGGACTAATGLPFFTSHFAAMQHSLEGHSPTLRSVGLKGSPLRAAVPCHSVLAGLAQCGSLQSLHLQQAGLDSTCLQQLCGVLRRMPHLQHINLSKNTFNSASEFDAAYLLTSPVWR